MRNQLASSGNQVVRLGYELPGVEGHYPAVAISPVFQRLLAFWRRACIDCGITSM
jgi:hypothetical protein